MEVLALIDKVKNYNGKATKKVKATEPLSEYSGKTPKELKAMLRSMLMARRMEREEKLLLRKGYNRFFIGCGGKEMCDVVFAEYLRPDDPFFGYYRNKAFDVHRGVPLEWKMLEAIGDPRSPNKGLQIPSHPAYQEYAIIPQSSPPG